MECGLRAPHGSRRDVETTVKYLETPAAFLAAIFVGIFAFGIGLTSPIWLIVSGRQPLEAIHAGTPIVGATIIGLIITVILGLIAHGMRKPVAVEQEDTTQQRTAPISRGKSMVIEVVVMLMFVVPLLTIIVGYLLHSIIDLGSPS